MSNPQNEGRGRDHGDSARRDSSPADGGRGGRTQSPVGRPPARSHKNNQASLLGGHHAIPGRGGARPATPVSQRGSTSSNHSSKANSTSIQPKKEELSEPNKKLRWGIVVRIDNQVSNTQTRLLQIDAIIRDYQRRYQNLESTQKDLRKRREQLKNCKSDSEFSRLYTATDSVINNFEKEFSTPNEDY